ncbi:hypothetical protein [Lentzea flava]|uniref:hypothetical protein n=1 Tax=Lentzea flava TaxID=103732 RepID=UPI00166F9932|nr:hypothetical protein [Lentzea flava]MCP2197386.1 hypothetical protein [Lentzea flava]
MKPEIERLYEVFAAPRPAVVEFCDHCVDAADIAPFTTVPLRELSAEQVEKYWLKSGTVGDEAFVRYLLPRVLELIAAGELDVDFFWLRMATGTHERGDERKKRAIEEYFEATPRALAALVEEELRNGKGVDERLAEWLRRPEPLAVLEEAALTGPDPDGALSSAHLVLEAHLWSK